MLFFGIFSAIVLIITQGNVKDLVIIYAVNVFITFSVSLLGLVVYWWKKRNEKPRWLRSLALSLLAFVVCVIILVITVITNIFPSGILALLFTALVISIGYSFKRAYQRHSELKRKLDKSLEIKLGDREEVNVMVDKDAPTAVFLVNRLGASMHTILWVERLFPNHFKNYVFLSYGMVDTGTFGSTKSLDILQTQTNRILKYLTYFSTQRGIAAVIKQQFGTQPIEDMVSMAEEINVEFSNTVYFSARYIYPDENLFTRMMHSDFSLMVQRKLQNMGVKMLIVPLELSI